MIRQWTIVALSVGLLCALGLTAASRADDEKKSELGQLMEKIQKENAAVLKGTRNVANYRKMHDDVQKNAKELVALLKKAKPMKDALKNGKDEKDPQQKWNELSDDIVKELESFEKTLADPATKAPEAKAAYKKVSKQCTACHKIFRVDDDEF